MVILPSTHKYTCKIQLYSPNLLENSCIFDVMEKKRHQILLFVYNANSGKRNALMDSVHKVFSPQTYDCKLCELTFGTVLENRTWKKFRQETDREMVFLHKDEFAKKYKSKFGYKFSFPIVLTEGGNGLEVLIATGELNQLKTVQSLVGLVKERLELI